MRIANIQLAKFEGSQQPPDSGETPGIPAISSPITTNISWRAPRDEEQPPVEGESSSKFILPIEAALIAGVIDFAKSQKWNKSHSTKRSRKRKDSGHLQD